jgi:hypothetical protein
MTESGADRRRFLLGEIGARDKWGSSDHQRMKERELWQASLLNSRLRV